MSLPEGNLERISWIRVQRAIEFKKGHGPGDIQRVQLGATDPPNLQSSHSSACTARRILTASFLERKQWVSIIK
ncbi:MAG: hypothetical protein PVI20_18180, partial [Desulfobacteraceae bacterium]